MQKEQLAKLLNESQLMSNELVNIRNSIASNALSSRYNQPSTIIVQATKNRELLRTLAQTLQTNRNLVQINKQKIQKSRIVLQGLQYFKKTLKDKIQGYYINVQQIQQYFEQPLQPIDWQNNYEYGENKLKQSLQKLKEKNEKYRMRTEQKNELQKKIDEKHKLYNNFLMKQIKKLNQHVLQTTKTFGIQTNQQLQKIQNIQLAFIFDSFKTLKVVQKIDITYGKQQYQFIDLLIKPTGLELYERALQYKIKLQQKELKIKITSLKPDFHKLTIGIDRRCDFNNRDIFHKLINKQEIKPIFNQALNQLQRNLNNKFIYAQWIENILCLSSIQNSQFLSIVRKRIFYVTLIKSIFDNIKNPTWLNSICPVVFNQIFHRKFIIQNVQKIEFQDYKLLVSMPFSLAQSINCYEQNVRKSFTYENQSQFHQKLHRQKYKILQILGNIGLEELLLPELYQYYKLVITYGGLRGQCVVMISYEYPQIAPKIKVISLQKPGDDGNASAMNSIQCKAKIDNRIVLSQQAQVVQKQSNNPFPMLNSLDNEPFRILYYIGKLFQSIYGIHINLCQRKKIKK